LTQPAAASVIGGRVSILTGTLAVMGLPALSVAR
jgi:hypothetical protein